MSVVEFAPAKRENVPLLIGLAGGTGSGKTYSAMRLAKGLAGSKRFAVVDTENGRAKHYADDFDFDHADLRAPFSPARYADAIETAASKGYGVVVVDSMSHEYAGAGGVLEHHDEEYERMGSRDAVLMAAWIKPKREHKKMVDRLLQVPAHVILCFRAEQKIEMKKGERGKTEIVLRTGLNVVDGWTMLTEKNLPYELTMSLLLMADAPGIPKKIKLQEQHKPIVSLEKPIDEETGKRLAAWARGSSPEPAPQPAAQTDEIPFGDAEVRPGDPLDVATFKRLCDEAAVPPTRMRSVGRRLFPGQTPSSLTDDERGQFWAELEREKAMA